MADYTKVNESIESGEYWKAKEIRQGRIAFSKTLDTELLSKYGIVLYLMGDYLEAGKYLFLSGVNDKKYRRAVSLFLERYANATERELFSTFPKSVYRAPKSEFPESVIKELELRRFDLNNRHDVRSHIKKEDNPAKEWIVEKALWALFWLVVSLIFIGAYVSVKTVVSWLV